MLGSVRHRPTPARFSKQFLHALGWIRATVKSGAHEDAQSAKATTVASGGGRLYHRTRNRREETATKTSGKPLATILALVLGALSLTGCGVLGQGKVLMLANMGWDENVAVSNLTKVLL